MEIGYEIKSYLFLSDAIKYEYIILDDQTTKINPKLDISFLFITDMEIMHKRNHIFGENSMFETKSNTELVPLIRQARATKFEISNQPETYK